MAPSEGSRRGRPGHANDPRPAARSTAESSGGYANDGLPPAVHSIATDSGRKRALSLRKPPPDSCAPATRLHTAPRSRLTYPCGVACDQGRDRFPHCCTCWAAGSASACSHICCCCRCCGCRGRRGRRRPRPRGLAAPATAACPHRSGSATPGLILERLAQHTRTVLGVPRGVDRVHPAGRAERTHTVVAAAGTDPEVIGMRVARRAPSWAGSRPRP